MCGADPQVRAEPPGSALPQTGQGAGRERGRPPHKGVWHWPLLFVIILAPAAHAQLDLFVVEGNTERAVSQSYGFGSVYAEETASAHFRLRNMSKAAAIVDLLKVAGAGFTLAPPALPASLAPQASLDFTVAFHAIDIGSYSASLNSVGVAILLTANVAPRLTYRIEPGSTAAFPGAVDFGNVVSGSTATRRITIQNNQPAVLTIPVIAVQGADFALQGAVPSGQALQPGQSAGFALVFNPHALGQSHGTLVLGDRSYPLLGAGINPPLPKPTLSVDVKQAASGQQGTLIVRFDAPAQASGTGTATLGFLGPADSTIAFAAGGRTIAFPIAPGDTQAVLPFQTGTSAGDITFTVEIDGAIDQSLLTIAAVAPVIDSAQAVRSTGALEVRIVGYDNTHSLGALSFMFYDAAGNPVPPGAIRTDAATDFAKYFATSDLGGVFLLRAVFPVTGDVSQVVSCQATLANSAGSANTPRTSF